MGRRRIKGEAARARIVAASLDIFAERGFYGASVRQLAAAAGGPTASLLHHFPTKERLYSAALAHIAADLQARVAPTLDPPGTHPARLRRFVRAYVDWVVERPAYARILLRELLDNPARLAAGPVSFPLRGPMDRLIRFVRDGQQAGTFLDIDPYFFVVHFFGSMSFYIAARPSLKQLVTDQRVLSRARLERESLRLAERLLVVGRA